MESKGNNAKNRPVIVLLVQTDPDLLEITRKCLMLQGEIVVETALSANEAFEKMETTKPDAIVCDLDLPFENSLDFLKRIRASGDATPFISFAYDDEKDLVFKSIDLGANGFVYKSNDAPDVYKGLKKLIDSLTRAKTRFQTKM